MMKFDPQKHHRRSIRLKGYDYTQAGAYFVTMVTWRREPLFGEIVDGETRLNGLGQVVQREWERLTHRFPHIQLDAFVVMPNHVHAIIFIVDGRGEASAIKKPVLSESLSVDASPQHAPIGTQPGSLGAIIQNFKSISARKINQIRCMRGSPLWQRNYYEHIIRHDGELNRIRQYISDNPRRWAEDNENPRRNR
jgi:REP element-mobilizing transposase RayT